MQKISPQQQEEIRHATHDWLEKARQLFAYDFAEIEVDFDLKGRSAGMYQVKYQQRRIRYNPYLFARYYEDNLNNTVPHEVAHYVVDMLYRRKRVKPHGKEWQEVMSRFGVDAKVTYSFQLDDVPLRQYQRVAYRCGCRAHQLTLIRHNRILKGAYYKCKHCQQTLKQCA